MVAALLVRITHNGEVDVLHRLDHNTAAETKTIEYLRLEQDRMMRRCMQLKGRRSWVVMFVPRLLLRRWRRCVLAGVRKWLNSSEMLECSMAIESGDLAEQRIALPRLFGCLFWRNDVSWLGLSLFALLL